MELLIGCGGKRDKRLSRRGREAWSDLATLDHEARHAPDVVHDLDLLPLPFGDDGADEIHAYHVLEHCGRQGDWRFYFAQWQDFWRILKPGGTFFGIVPAATSVWAWGDPSHTRVITAESLTFLTQPEYDKQVGVTALSDFRSVFSGDFDLIFMLQDAHEFSFALRCVKPSRITCR